ncbi:MAG: diguanylate cyclase [Calothrix sp. C42_A2020_038]|nr:diguanylate cyclase [Calothrix sp. C42_A2020_038]
MMDFDMLDETSQNFDDLSFLSQIQLLQIQNKHLENLCYTDDLTKLRNKRYFCFCLEQCWKELACHQAPLSLIFLDIDNLKIYNLTQGEQAGDKCVCQIADVVSRCVDKTGALSVRYQDDTFAAILPNITTNNALELSETIREEVKNLGIKHAISRLGGLKVPVVTVSLGVACTIPKLEQSSSVLVDAALRALNRAKKLEGDSSCVSTSFQYGFINPD